MSPPPPGALHVLATGPRTTVQDVDGRPGRAALGVGVSGAADRRALRLANRLVGNDARAAGLEVTLGGLAVRVTTTAVVAVCGAPAVVAVHDADGRPRRGGPGSAVVVPAGGTIALGVPATGLRSYVAVRGGIAVDPVLDSRATDLLAGLGPPVLTEGAELPIGPWPEDPVPALDLAPEPAPPGTDAPTTVAVVLGPRDDWFTAAALAALTATSWTVTGDADRVGIRLDGPALTRTPDATGAELPSEGVVRGSIQVPASGRPTVFLADHPVTGGYPVIGVVADADTDVVGQLRPGAAVRFRGRRLEGVGGQQTGQSVVQDTPGPREARP